MCGLHWTACRSWFSSLTGCQSLTSVYSLSHLIAPYWLLLQKAKVHISLFICSKLYCDKYVIHAQTPAASNIPQGKYAPFHLQFRLVSSRCSISMLISIQSSCSICRDGWKVPMDVAMGTRRTAAEGSKHVLSFSLSVGLPTF